MQQRIVGIAVVDIAVIGLAHLIREVGDLDNAIVAWAIATVGLVTLLGLLSANDRQTRVTTRFAIAVSVSVVWVVSVGHLMFYTGSEGTLAGEAVNSLTLAMSVVIAFYFGAQAFETVARTRAAGDGDGAGSDEEDEDRQVAPSTAAETPPTEVWD